MGLFTKTDKKGTKKPRFNVKQWTGASYLSPVHTAAKAALKGLFIPQRAENKETFEAAIARLKLTPEQVAMREKRFRQNAYVFIMCAALAFAYAMYLLFHGHFSPALLGVAVMGLFLVQAFRFHFWAFQIKHKKLGCTFKQWWHSDVSRGDESK